MPWDFLMWQWSWHRTLTHQTFCFSPDTLARNNMMPIITLSIDSNWSRGQYTWICERNSLRTSVFKRCMVFQQGFYPCSFHSEYFLLWVGVEKQPFHTITHTKPCQRHLHWNILGAVICFCCIWGLGLGLRKTLHDKTVHSCLQPAEKSENRFSLEQTSNTTHFFFPDTCICIPVHTY